MTTEQALTSKNPEFKKVSLSFSMLVFVRAAVYHPVAEF